MYSDLCDLVRVDAEFSFTSTSFIMMGFDMLRSSNMIRLPWNTPSFRRSRMRVSEWLDVASRSDTPTTGTIEIVLAQHPNPARRTRSKDLNMVDHTTFAEPILELPPICVERQLSRLSGYRLICGVVGVTNVCYGYVKDSGFLTGPSQVRLHVDAGRRNPTPGTGLCPTLDANVLTLTGGCVTVRRINHCQDLVGHKIQ